jgi:uncharacterized protein YdaT
MYVDFSHDNSIVAIFAVRTAATTMSLEAARELSISELFRLLNEKLIAERTAVRDASLETEVRTRSHSTDKRGGRLSDQKSRNKSKRCPEARGLSAEPVTASEQVAAGDHFPNISMCPS